LTGDRWQDLEWYTSKLVRCKADMPRRDAAQDQALATVVKLLDQADWIQDTLYQLDHALRVAALPRLIIHGDYGPYNLLAKPNESVIVLDFELARLDWRITDLAKAIPNFARNRRTGFSFRHMECFLDAYQARSSLSAEELRLIPTVWQFLCIRRLVVCWCHYCDTRADRWLAEARDHLWWVNWITTNSDCLYKVLCQNGQ